MANCYECGGQGRRTVYACPGFREIEMDCPVCGNAGVISEEQARRHKLGQQLRETRLDEGYGQYGAAQLFGLKAYEYAHIEQGRVPMPDAIKAWMEARHDAS